MVDFWSFQRIKLMVNQIEINPFNQQKEALEWMKKYKIQPKAWSSFAEGKFDIFKNPKIAAIGKKYNKSIAQVILRWEIQLGIVVIPKSVNVDRMKQNFEVFDFMLSEEDMNEMAALDEHKTLFMPLNDPKTVEMFISWTGRGINQQ